MKLLLVNPRFPPSLWDFAGCSDVTGKAYAHPPLALPTIAALTPREHDVSIVDENVRAIDFHAAADVVGITGYHIQKTRLLEIADRFRARGLRVVIGGPIVDASTIGELLEHADAVFRGEAELTWPRFLDDLSRGEALRIYEQSELVDMRTSPVPRYELLDLDRYTTATIETSRGCPHACEFCEIPSRLGQKSRTKSVEHVLEEVRLLRSLGADSIFFIDDHFVGNRARTKRLLTELAAFVREASYALYFTCQFTINLARDEELLELFHAANFQRVFCGIETPRKESLLSVRKKQNVVGDLVANVRALQAHGFIVWAGMIVGFDTDDSDVFDEIRAFLDEAAIPVAMIGILQAIPGTPLYARMEREGRLREVAISGVRGEFESLLRSNIVPVGMDDRTLVRGYQALIRDAYDDEAYANRVLEVLRRTRQPVGSAPVRLDRERLALLGRIVRTFVLTQDAPRRRAFLRVVRAVIRERPAFLEAALMHLVVQKHLRDFYHRLASLDVELPEAPPKTALRVLRVVA